MLAVFGTLALVFAALSMTAIYGVREMNAATSELADRWLAGVSAVDDLVAAFKDERLAISKHVLSTTEEGMTRQEALVEKSHETQAEHIAELRALSLSPKEVAALSEFEATGKNYEATWDKLRALSRSNQNEEALRVYDKELSPLGEKMALSLEAIAEANDEGAVKANTESDVA